MTAVQQMQKEMSLNRSLEYTGISKTAWYYEPRARKPKSDKAIMEQIRKIADKRPTYGTRRMAAQLSRDMQIPVNRKRVHRIYVKLGWIQAQKEVPRTAYRRKKLFIPLGPNQLWEIDITYVFCGKDGYCYCFNVFDAFTRKWVAYIFETEATSEVAVALVVKALSTIPEEDVKGLRIRCDNGTQFTSKHFRSNMKQLGVKCEYIHVHTPEQNGHVESFHGTLKKEYVWQYEFESFQEARKILKKARTDYNGKRIHSALGYLTPDEYVYLWNEAEEDANK